MAKISKTITNGQESEEYLDLQRWPFYWITQANNLYMEKLEVELKISQLDIPTWRALNLLGGGQGRSISYLAKESIVKLSTMTRIIQRMRDKGLVTVQPSKGDARVTEVHLTKRGENARVIALGHARSVMETAFQGVKPEYLEILISSLSNVVENMMSQD